MKQIFLKTRINLSHADASCYRVTFTEQEVHSMADGGYSVREPMQATLFADMAQQACAIACSDLGYDPRNATFTTENLSAPVTGHTLNMANSLDSLECDSLEARLADALVTLQEYKRANRLLARDVAEWKTIDEIKVHDLAVVRSDLASRDRKVTYQAKTIRDMASELQGCYNNMREQSKVIQKSTKAMESVQDILDTFQD